MSFAMAIGFIAIVSAQRTDTLAFFAADALHRELQKNLLPQNIFQFETGKFIKSHFRFALVDGNFISTGRGGFCRPIEKVERDIDSESRAAQTTVTFRFERGINLPFYTDLAVGMGQ